MLKCYETMVRALRAMLWMLPDMLHHHRWAVRSQRRARRLARLACNKRMLTMNTGKSIQRNLGERDHASRMILSTTVKALEREPCRAVRSLHDNNVLDARELSVSLFFLAQ